MTDQDDIKVVDRRWWARDHAEGEAEEPASFKPTYVEELERQIAEKDTQVQEYLSRYRAAATEFEEARARMRRDQAREIDRGRRVIITELLEVLDNLDRAIDAARQAPASVDTLLQGVELVRNQFLSKLDGFGVTRVDPLGEPFDPVLHEAVTSVPAADPRQDGTIVGVVRPGYVAGDEVLRPAMVAVAHA
jgi:molecular chaperone GrpE